MVVDALVLKWNTKATEIQRIVRGIQDRARVVIVRIRRDAAVKIQSLMRGEVARITTTHGVYWCVRCGLSLGSQSQVHNLKFTQASQAYLISIISTYLYKRVHCTPPAETANAPFFSAGLSRARRQR